MNFMDFLAKKYNFKTKEDWYKISTNHFIENNGRTLMGKYRGSASGVVMSLFKDHAWLNWKFNEVQQGFWRDILFFYVYFL